MGAFWYFKTYEEWFEDKNTALYDDIEDENTALYDDIEE